MSQKSSQRSKIYRKVCNRRLSSFLEVFGDFGASLMAIKAFLLKVRDFYVLFRWAKNNAHRLVQG